jgi:hypothetical protein
LPIHNELANEVDEIAALTVLNPAGGHAWKSQTENEVPQAFAAE